MERRDFLKTGGVALAGAVLLPHLFESCGNHSKDVSRMLAHFGVTESDLQKVIATALEEGDEIGLLGGPPLVGREGNKF